MSSHDMSNSEPRAPYATAPSHAEMRNRAVLKALQEATGPLGPTDIARRVNEEWCMPKGGYPISAAITPICRRLGLQSVKGKYQIGKPQPE